MRRSAKSRRPVERAERQARPTLRRELLPLPFEERRRRPCSAQPSPKRKWPGLPPMPPGPRTETRPSAGTQALTAVATPLTVGTPTFRWASSRLSLLDATVQMQIARRSGLKGERRLDADQAAERITQLRSGLTDKAAADRNPPNPSRKAGSNSAKGGAPNSNASGAGKATKGSTPSGGTPSAEPAPSPAPPATGGTVPVPPATGARCGHNPDPPISGV